CSRIASGSFACLLPLNIMCSKRWANPLRPGVWLAAPSWYQTLTETWGRRWSSLRTMVRPFGSRYFSNLRSGSSARAGIAQSAAARTRTRRNTCCLLAKGTALLLPTLPRRKPGRTYPAPAPSPCSQTRRGLERTRRMPRCFAKRLLGAREVPGAQEDFEPIPSLPRSPTSRAPCLLLGDYGGEPGAG